jgi:hypothetical protein
MRLARCMFEGGWVRGGEIMVRIANGGDRVVRMESW